MADRSLGSPSTTGAEGEVAPPAPREWAYPPTLEKAEGEAVRQRREKADPAASEAAGPGGRLPADTVGFALSGGGIRSATFCLGVFQALARRSLLRKIDFVSTVSGGGYFGGFLGALYSRQSAIPNGGAANVEEKLADSTSTPIRWLRENGRYMSPNGSGDLLLAGAVLLRNWIAVQVVLALSTLTLFLLVSFVRAALVLDAPAVDWLKPLFPDSSGGILWWSPYFVVPLLTFVGGAGPLGWSYWLTQWTPRANRPEDKRAPLITLPTLTVLAVGIGAVAGALLRGRGGSSLAVLALWALALAAFLALFYWWLCEREALAKLHAADLTDTGRRRYVRSHLSRAVSRYLWVTVGLLAFSLIDSLGQTLYVYLRYHGRLVAALPGLSALLGVFGLLQKLPGLIGGKTAESRLRLSPGLLAGAGAFVLTGIFLVSLSALGHAIAWQGGLPAPAATLSWSQPRPPAGRVGVDGAQHLVVIAAPEPAPVVVPGPLRVPSRRLLLVASFVGVLLTVACGRTLSFLNLSSHQSLYGARLTRAYLGASNPKRESGDGSSVTEVINGDDFALEDYAPHRQGGPLHLVNVTVNETIDGKSQIEQRDRKGMGMAVGPSGLSVGVRHHALWEAHKEGAAIRPIPVAGPDGFSVFPATPPERSERPVEALSLGTWTAISGAAFTTGLGARTSLGLSLLLGLANVRLGYWWDSRVSPEERSPSTKPWAWPLHANRALPVQTHLLDELLARFPGTAQRRWYLSDGGHFENTGAYELIRRRLPFIVVLDDGQDAGYDFEDLAGLVRKARLDFGAEIVFFTGEEVRGCVTPVLAERFGSPDRFREERGAQPHALLAWVFYDDPLRAGAPGSVILFVKPSLSGDEPYDVRQYKQAHQDFPNEPTMDQFFDEAQWESYRRLGEHIGETLFAEPTDDHWWPARMRRP